MKSKRAEAEAIRGSFSAVYNMAKEEAFEKAAKAFCEVHCPKGCPFDNSDGCGAIREFKQKMKEA